MQSGISASEALQQAFAALIAAPTPGSTPPSRGILARIDNEVLVPAEPIPTTSPTSTLSEDLGHLSGLLKDDRAEYILLRENDTADNSFTGVAKCVAITYVPDAAPVRQKMLFASTRLTLVRELGTEHFSSTLFATEKSELTAEGWSKQLEHGKLSAPLTEEERSLEGIKEAEAAESIGTGARRGGHVVAGGVSMPVTKDAVDALKGLKSDHNLVILNLDLQTEQISLLSTHSNVTPPNIQSIAPTSKPTYSFYYHQSTSEILFIYFCPAGCSVKERMTYAASARSVPVMAEKEAGVNVSKKIEASELDELSEKEILREVEPNRGTSTGGAGGFARPKRPGKR